MQKYAILSVSDKSGIADFAKGLVALDYKIISTGGTLKTLLKEGIVAIDISEYTQVEEMFDGRVKTLHPKVHGGILYRRDNENDVKCANSKGIVSIDVVCVNLYPFYETTKRTNDFDEIIENIDIGGPSLIRAAAKNFNSVFVVVDRNDYSKVLESLRNRDCSIDFRRELMIKAFSHTANYDCIIANYMNERFESGFGDKCFIVGNKVMQTNYGENPHQKGALYEFQSFYSTHFKTLKGNMSFNNLTDINAAVKIASAFGNVPCVCIIKHGNPCGFAIGNNLLDAYQKAMICDNVSAYGGVVAINGVIDRELANEILKSYVEVVVCADISSEVLDMFASKKRIKFATSSSGDSKLLYMPSNKYDFKHIQGGFVYQESDSIESSEVENAKQVGKHAISNARKMDLEIAYKLAAFTKSNCVTFVKDRVLVAIGMGMTSRVDAMEAAIKKAAEMGVSLKDSTLASEAFFPFKDSVEIAARVGVAAIIEPGGSIRDKEVIQEADDSSIAIYFSGKRHFLH